MTTIFADFTRLWRRVQPVSQIKKRKRRKEEQKRRDAYYAEARSNRQERLLPLYSSHEWSV